MAFFRPRRIEVHHFHLESDEKKTIYQILPAP
jgi:hypothetical protein